MPKITKDYQEGYCSVCGNETLVRVLVSEKRVASVCKDCISKVGNLTINELISKFGEDINLKAS